MMRSILFLAAVATCLVWFSGTAMATPDSAESSVHLKMDQEAPSPDLRVLRNAGVGLGFGALAGTSFILASQGKFPSDRQQFDNEALINGMVIGALGGALLGYWQIRYAKRSKILLSASPSEKTIAEVVAHFDF